MLAEDSDSYASTVESMSDLDVKEKLYPEHDDHANVPMDQHYDDPKANLSILTADGICFQVDAWTMGKKSKFIRTQLSLSQDRSVASGNPIELDFSSQVVRMFIDGMYSRHDFSIDMTVPQFKDLFGLCDLFQAPKQELATARALKERFMSSTEEPFDPWEVFKLAAERDNVEIARLAAVKLEENDRSLSHLVLANPPSFFDGVPPRYVYALARSSLWYHDRVKLPWGGTGGTWIKRGPGDIADAFKLD